MGQPHFELNFVKHQREICDQDLQIRLNIDQCTCVQCVRSNHVGKSVAWMPGMMTSSEHSVALGWRSGPASF